MTSEECAKEIIQFLRSDMDDMYSPELKKWYIQQVKLILERMNDVN